MARLSELNIDWLEKEYNNYLTTDEGKEFVISYYKNYRKEEAYEYAEKLKQLIVSFALSQFNLSQMSIINNINDIDIGDVIERSDGSYEINLYLSGDLTRPSLNPNKEGAYDIVSLFIHGWKQTQRNKNLFGLWHGRWTKAMSSRPPMTFASDAVEAFNRIYEKYDIHAELGGEYM